MQTLGQGLTSLIGAATVCTVATVAHVGVQPAQAASITFDLTGPLSDASSFDFTVDDVTLIATGFNGDGALDVRRTQSFGLGIVDNAGPDNQIDSRQNNPETLRLTLSQQVKIISAVFSRVNTEANPNDDAFNLRVNGGEVNLLWGALPPGDNGLFTFTSPISTTMGTTFDFSAVQADDDYSLKSVTFETVPEPLTILGTVAAAGMGYVARRRQLAQQNDA